MSTPTISPISPLFLLSNKSASATPAACVKFTAIGTSKFLSFLANFLLSLTFMPNGFSKNKALPISTVFMAYISLTVGGHAR